MICLALSGCFSIDISSTDGQIMSEHVVVSNYGWYLFHFIPLTTGNATPGGWCPFTLFRNDVTMEKIQTRFMDYAQERHLKPQDISYHNTESVMLEIPGLGIMIPIPYLITYREIQLSGVMK